MSEICYYIQKLKLRFEIAAYMRMHTPTQTRPAVRKTNA